MAQETGNATSDAMASLGLQAMMEMQRPALAAIAELNGRLYDSIAAANEEWASFINRRFREDLTVPRQLAECKTVQDLYRVYARFFENVYADYQSELDQMTKLGRSIAENALQPLQSRSERTGQSKSTDDA